MAGFRDKLPGFAAENAQVLGISMDTLQTQTDFAKKLDLPFPLLADPEGTVARAYGVANEKGFANRVTFVVGKDGKVVKVLEGKDALDPSGALAACTSKKGP